MVVMGSSGLSLAQNPTAENVQPGGSVTVSVRFNATGYNAPALDLILPQGWTVMNYTTDGGTYRSNRQQWVWLSGGVKEISYTLKAPNTESGTALVELNGTAIDPETDEFVSKRATISISATSSDTPTSTSNPDVSTPTVTETSQPTNPSSTDSPSENSLTPTQTKTPIENKSRNVTSNQSESPITGSPTEEGTESSEVPDTTTGVATGVAGSESGQAATDTNEATKTGTLGAAETNTGVEADGFTFSVGLLAIVAMILQGLWQLST